MSLRLFSPIHFDPKISKLCLLHITILLSSALTYGGRVSTCSGSYCPYKSHWTTFPTPGSHYASESGYTDSKITLEWLKRVFDLQTKGQANKKPRVLICDGFSTHETLEVQEFYFENNIILCRLPSHTSHKLQSCDIGVFERLKGFYRDEVDRLFRGGANAVGKENFTSLYSPARERHSPKEIFSRHRLLAACFRLTQTEYSERRQSPSCCERGHCGQGEV